MTGLASTPGIALTVTDVRGLAITPAGICYAIVNGVPDLLYTINLGTGTMTLVGATGSSSLQALAPPTLQASSAAGRSIPTGSGLAP